MTTMQEPPTFEVLHELVAPAKRNISKGHWDYLWGGSDTETTYERNRVAIDSIAFRPRVLRNVEKVDTGGKLLGHALKLPIILAPIGSLQDFTPEGGAASTRAAARTGTMHMLSTVSAPGLEAVAACTDHPKMFQLYVRGDEAWIDSHVERAIKNNYVAVCFTVDLDHYGRRERDIAKRHKTTSRKSVAADHFQARFTWDDLDRVMRKYKVPIILKGIATAEDARIAVEHGVAAIYVSNHGGRQLDHGKGSIAVLPEVVEAVAGRAEVIVDGGFMRGTDIVKAMALGASAVGIGRLQGLALAAGGADGMVRAIELLKDEVTRCLGLLGVTSYKELDANYVTPVAPLPRTALDSAFPLLREGY
jgi:isopentenyl diphosphate isomerase/L-lactate dehydrogenase-like FMN-dependent dehydrogenase